MTKRYISEIIGEEYKEWSSEKPIVIHAPMGAGKTYFILNILLKYIHKQGKKLLYVANRSALKEQVKLDVPMEYSDSITVVNYQRLANVSLDQNESFCYREETEHQKMDREIRNADYYVFDEAHYFLADTTFNTEIEKCYTYMQYLFESRKNCICIYMTATLPYLFLLFKEKVPKIPFLLPTSLNDHYSYSTFMSVNALLTYKEESDWTFYKYRQWMEEKAEIDEEKDEWWREWNLNGLGPMPRGNYMNTEYFISRAKEFELSLEPDDKIRMYWSEPDFSYITPLYFTRWEEIVFAIQHSPKNEKWLIFVQDSGRGDELEKMLGGPGIDTAVFISSKKRSNKKTIAGKTFDDITRDSKFYQKVLIATKVLDNGINLKDPELRHVVIDFFDETTFLQMIGRKRRLEENDRMNLYIQNLSEGTVRKNFENRILQVLIFWHTLHILQNRKKYWIENPNSFQGGLMRDFYRKYTSNGQYKPSFGKYLDEGNLRFFRFDKIKIKDAEYLLVDSYTPAGYAVKKITYDYYQMMAMFEGAYNERRTLKGIKEPYVVLDKKVEKELQRNQFMWLKEQLGWIGMNDQEHNPAKPDYWLSTWSKRTSQCKSELEHFLESHSVGEYLTEHEQGEFKKLVLGFIESIAPPHADSQKNLKASLKYVNKWLTEFQMPYTVASEQKTIDKHQRNWWIIRKV